MDIAYCSVTDFTSIYNTWFKLFQFEKFSKISRKNQRINRELESVKVDDESNRFLLLLNKQGSV